MLDFAFYPKYLSNNSSKLKLLYSNSVNFAIVQSKEFNLNSNVNNYSKINLIHMNKSQFINMLKYNKFNINVSNYNNYQNLNFIKVCHLDSIRYNFYNNTNIAYKELISLKSLNNNLEINNKKLLKKDFDQIFFFHYLKYRYKLNNFYAIKKRFLQKAINKKNNQRCFKNIKLVSYNNILKIFNNNNILKNNFDKFYLGFSRNIFGKFYNIILSFIDYNNLSYIFEIKLVNYNFINLYRLIYYFKPLDFFILFYKNYIFIFDEFDFIVSNLIFLIFQF